MRGYVVGTDIVAVAHPVAGNSARRCRRRRRVPGRRRHVAASVAPAILQMYSQVGRRGIAPDQPRAVRHHVLGRSGDHREPRDVGPRHPRCAQYIDEQLELELILDERLHAGARPAESSVTQPNLDDVAGPQIAVLDVDQQRFLEGAFATLDVVTGDQLLHGGGRGFRGAADKRPADQTRRRIIACLRIGRLQIPVGVKAEAQLQPAAVRDARLPHGVGEDQFFRRPGDHTRRAALQRSQKWQRV